MTIRSLSPLIVATLLTFSLAACSASPATPSPIPDSSTNASVLISASVPAAANTARSDSSGAVKFTVTPLNLASPGEALAFQVVMDTHSVDLAWDLAAQSILRADTGREVPGRDWPVGNGHHYEGTLTFPPRTAAGDLLLDGATRLTLVIRDTDVPERFFVWESLP